MWTEISSNLMEEIGLIGDSTESAVCNSVGGTFPSVNTDQIPQCGVKRLLKMLMAFPTLLGGACLQPCMPVLIIDSIIVDEQNLPVLFPKI